MRPSDRVRTKRAASGRIIIQGNEDTTMEEFRGSQNYVASEELLRAANIAMVLQKPLLIKGEPGTGKTMLAEAISQALGKTLII